VTTRIGALSSPASMAARMAAQRQELQPPETDVEREVIMAAAMHTTVANVSNSVVARVAK